MGRKPYKQYAIYKDDEFIDIGIAKKLAEKYNLTLKTFYWYATSRRYKSKEHKRGYTIFQLEDE